MSRTRAPIRHETTMTSAAFARHETRCVSCRATIVYTRPVEQPPDRVRRCHLCVARAIEAERRNARQPR